MAAETPGAERYRKSLTSAKYYNSANVSALGKQRGDRVSPAEPDPDAPAMKMVERGGADKYYAPPIAVPIAPAAKPKDVVVAGVKTDPAPVRARRAVTRKDKVPSAMITTPEGIRDVLQIAAASGNHHITVSSAELLRRTVAMVDLLIHQSVFPPELHRKFHIVNIGGSSPAPSPDPALAVVIPPVVEPVAAPVPVSPAEQPAAVVATSGDDDNDFGKLAAQPQIGVPSAPEAVVAPLPPPPSRVGSRRRSKRTVQGV